MWCWWHVGWTLETIWKSSSRSQFGSSKNVVDLSRSVQFGLLEDYLNITYYSAQRVGALGSQAMTLWLGLYPQSTAQGMSLDDTPCHSVTATYRVPLGTLGRSLYSHTHGSLMVLQLIFGVMLSPISKSTICSMDWDKGIIMQQYGKSLHAISSYTGRMQGGNSHATMSF